MRGGNQVSQSQEDYIKFIYENNDGDFVDNKRISQGLNLAPPSVSEMMHRLQTQDLVDYVPYRGVKLTAKGTKLAEELIRKHLIWEYFLSQKLKYTDEEVHVLAEVLEHVTPIDLANRLADYIDFPE